MRIVKLSENTNREYCELVRIDATTMMERIRNI